MVAALGRVNGVSSATVNSARTEVIVVRDARYTLDSELTDVVRRVGYSATLVPTQRVHLRVQDLDCGGCPTRASSALRSARGTRKTMLNAKTGAAEVIYDRRMTDAATLVKVLKRAGFQARVAD